jgi:Dyp-type peroxidase family
VTRVTPRYPGLDEASEPGRRILASVQGNVLKGHGREHAIFAAVHCRRPPAGDGLRAWLAGIRVTTAIEQSEASRAYAQHGASGPPFVGLHLGAACYSALGVPPSARPRDAAFRAGMKHASVLRLDDPPPAEWEPAFRERILAVLLVADDDPRVPGEVALKLTETLPDGARATLVRGKTLRDAHGAPVEPFGFADGISQPLCLKRDVERWRSTGARQWDPTADPLSLLLVRDPLAPGTYGSYAVYRKLEQDVESFRRHAGMLSERLGSRGWEPGATLAVGRAPDGAPLAGAALDDFDYADDPDGERCPLAAHTRRMNPRVTDPSALARRLARRGIPYQDEAGRGLHFLAFQRDLTRQFEFLQRFWANARAPSGDGADPIAGQPPRHAAPIPQRWPGPHGVVRCLLGGHVRLRGGEYLYAPSPQALDALGAEP